FQTMPVMLLPVPRKQVSPSTQTPPEFRYFATRHSASSTYWVPLGLPFLKLWVMTKPGMGCSGWSLASEDAAPVSLAVAGSLSWGAVAHPAHAAMNRIVQASLNG